MLFLIFQFSDPPPAFRRELLNKSINLKKKQTFDFPKLARLPELSGDRPLDACLEEPTDGLKNSNRYRRASQQPKNSADHPEDYNHANPEHPEGMRLNEESYSFSRGALNLAANKFNEEGSESRSAAERHRMKNRQPQSHGFYPSSIIDPNSIDSGPSVKVFLLAEKRTAP